MLFYLNKLFCVQVLFLPCYNNFADNNAFFTVSLVDSCILTNGSLTSSLHRPKSFAAYFAGAGLLSINRALWSGWSKASILSASLISLSEFDFENFWKSEHNLGATFAVTEIIPTPPLLLNSKARPS